MGYSFLQLSLEEEIEVRSWLAATEIEERRKEIEREEKELKGKEEWLKQKVKKIKNTVIKTERIAAQKNRGGAGPLPGSATDLVDWLFIKLNNKLMFGFQENQSFLHVMLGTINVHCM